MQLKFLRFICAFNFRSRADCFYISNVLNVYYCWSWNGLCIAVCTKWYQNKINVHFAVLATPIIEHKVLCENE